MPPSQHSTLSPIFIRLETQAATFTFGRRRELISSAYTFGAAGHEDEIPPQFHSIEEARNSLGYIRIVVARAAPLSARNILSYTLEAAQTQVAIELIRSVGALRLRQWSAAFSSFIATQSHPIPSETRHSILILEIHKLLLDISFKIDFSRGWGDETVWDPFTSEFETAIAHATEILTPSSTNPATTKQRVFNLDIGLIIPLFFVAGKCRHYWMRRKAIELLRVSERQEGILNSALAARVAESLVGVEEEGLLGREGEYAGAVYVPREKRVVGVEIRFGAEGEKAFLRYMRKADGFL